MLVLHGDHGDHKSTREEGVHSPYTQTHTCAHTHIPCMHSCWVAELSELTHTWAAINVHPHWYAKEVCVCVCVSVRRADMCAYSCVMCTRLRAQKAVVPSSHTRSHTCAAHTYTTSCGYEKKQHDEKEEKNGGTKERFLLGKLLAFLFHIENSFLCGPSTSCFHFVRSCGRFILCVRRIQSLSDNSKHSLLLSVHGFRRQNRVLEKSNLYEQYAPSLLKVKIKNDKRNDYIKIFCSMAFK